MFLSSRDVRRTPAPALGFYAQRESPALTAQHCARATSHANAVICLCKESALAYARCNASTFRLVAAIPAARNARSISIPLAKMGFIQPCTRGSSGSTCANAAVAASRARGSDSCDVAAQPMGTVTFLFSDVEAQRGCSNNWAPSAMQRRWSCTGASCAEPSARIAVTSSGRGTPSSSRSLGPRTRSRRAAGQRALTAAVWPEDAELRERRTQR
jgi:hypothetical protein